MSHSATRSSEYLTGIFLAGLGAVICTGIVLVAMEREHTFRARRAEKTCPSASCAFHGADIYPSWDGSAWRFQDSKWWTVFHPFVTSACGCQTDPLDVLAGGLSSTGKGRRSLEAFEMKTGANLRGLEDIVFGNTDSVSSGDFGSQRSFNDEKCRQ